MMNAGQLYMSAPAPAQPKPVQVVHTTFAESQDSAKQYTLPPVVDYSCLAFIDNVPLSLSAFQLDQLLWACGPVSSSHEVLSSVT